MNIDELKELKEIGFSNLHGHTDKNSNLRFLDSTIKVNEMLDFAKKNNYKAISLTGHESLSDHITAERIYNKSYSNNFKLVLGNEIYLVDKNEMENAEKNNLKSNDFRFNHFLFNALDKKGHEFLQKQSTLAWQHEHMYLGQQRVPSFYQDIEDLMTNGYYKGHVIASTACLGGCFAENILNYKKTLEFKYLEKAKKFIQWGIKVFGSDNFKLELMPSKTLEQNVVNKYAIEFSEKYNIDYIITTDAHYLNDKQRYVHNALLHSRNINRDLTPYDTAHLFTIDELTNYFDFEVLKKGLQNINSVVDRVQNYSFENTPDVPQPVIEEFKTIDKNDIPNIEKYEYIEKFVDSNNEQDRYLITLLIHRLVKKNLLNSTYLNRVEIELREIFEISKILKQPLSSYFLVMREFIKIMWKTSVVGAGRGSSSCYLINYLLGITQVDAVKYDLPYYRFLSKERVTSNTASQFPDIDTDTASSQRENVINLIKENRGKDHVLNFCTFSTIATRSSILTACRGLGIDNQTANYIVDLLPTKDGSELSIQDALLGNEEKGIKPSQQLLNEVLKYTNLKETILGLHGLIIGFSEHASGVYISNKPFTTHNAMMTTKNGINVTQFDADDSEYASALKYDFLSLDGCDRLQAALNLLLKEKVIEWQGSLYLTYQKYFNTENLDYTDQSMYDMLFSGEIINAFQFSSETGYKTLRKLNARTFEDLISGNALMRLRSDSEEQPLDKYIRFKNDKNAWENEMNQHGLNTQEKEVLHTLLDKYNGICSSQELLMQLSMTVAGFDLIQANKLRKAIAKKDPQKQSQQKEIFFNQGKQSGRRKEFLTYCWNNCIEIQNGYAFSLPHAIPYTMILITEMNICKRYGLIYWQTACLSVNSKTMTNEIESPDYPKIAKAIGSLKKGMVINPDINKSELGFTPNTDKNAILFGLNAINNIGKNEITSIINHRPYISFNDFIDKNKEVISEKKIVTLIKSGIFDCFNNNRKQLMISYINSIFKPKKRVSIVSVEKYKSKIPTVYSEQTASYILFKIIKKNKLNSKLEFMFIRNVAPKIANFEREHNKTYKEDCWIYKNNTVIIDQKRYKQWLDVFTEPLKEWLKTSDAINMECNFRKKQFWIENCLGSVPKWEMDSLNMYTKVHEIEQCSLPDTMNIYGFNDLPEHPTQIGVKVYKNIEYPQYKNVVIAGTVIDKNNTKGIVVVLTTNGVANVRVGRDRYSIYNKKVMTGTGHKRHCIDDTWFKRGTKLLLVGHRIHNDFKLSKNGTSYTTTLSKINIKNNKIHLISNKLDE